jgi:hypothetical protein
MRVFLILFILSLNGGCAQLMRGETQPVQVLDLKNKIMATTCSGLVEHWQNCYEKARKSCENGYQIINKIESPSSVRREITFQCNK